MPSDEVLKKIETVLHPAMIIYDNLNLGGQWSVPGCSVNAVPPACDNCGGPHIAPECLLPCDEEKIKKACEACVKAQAGHGAGCGRGRGGCNGKRGQWSSSDDSAKAAAYGS